MSISFMLAGVIAASGSTTAIATDPVLVELAPTVLQVEGKDAVKIDVPLPSGTALRCVAGNARGLQFLPLSAAAGEVVEVPHEFNA